MENIKINSATSDQIAKLYGIGNQLAKRIVEYRDAYGFFTSPDDLAKVDGISLELSLTLSPHINWEIHPELQEQKKRDYPLLLIFLAASLIDIYIILNRRIPDLLYRINQYLRGEPGSLIWVLIQICLSLDNIIMFCVVGFLVVWAIKPEQENDFSFIKAFSFSIIFFALDSGLVVILNAIYYQFYSPNGWQSFLAYKINLTSSINAFGVGLVALFLVLFAWKPLLLSKYLLKWIFDISLLIIGIGQALTIWSGNLYFPLWLLILNLLGGILFTIAGWFSIRDGHFIADKVIELLQLQDPNELNSFSVNWQAWINIRLPNPDDQKALRDILNKTYPISKARTILSILFVGTGGWLIVTTLASIVDWFVQRFLNSIWP